MKGSVKIIISALLLIALTTVKVNAQVLPGILGNFNAYNLNTPQEKVFLHLDKSTYTAGELMWFKVYNVDAADHRPFDLSKVVYVEVLDNRRNPVLQAKIAMKNGAGTGSLFLPVTLTTGNYLIRAYTSWMKNFNPDYYFNKQITIIDPLRSPEPQVKTQKADYDVQFFPEGGSLVSNLNNVLAFKATDRWGNGVNFTGAVLNSNNDTIAHFEPFKFGMGRFIFKPDNNALYHAVIKINGEVIQRDLPVINSKGYVIDVKDNNAGQLLVNVSSNQPDGNVYLIVHTANSVKVAETAAITNGTAQFIVDKGKLGAGISHFTLFNDDKQAVCERLYFKRPAKSLFINAVPDQQQYSTRKKVNITIDAKDEHDAAVMSDLSLSVYRLDSLQHPDPQTIENYLWLSSDLRGNIESPEYYFNNTGNEADEAADNLMLTQGWSRFNWSDVVNGKAPGFTFLPEFNGHIVGGKLINLSTGKPQKDVISYLAIPGKTVQLYAAASDSTGRLIFNTKNFYGPGEIVVQTNTTIDSNYRIDILNPFSEQYATITLSPLPISPAYRTAFAEHSLGMQLQNIYNVNQLRQFYDSGTDSVAFYGTPNNSYLLDNYTRFLTMEEVMREYVKEGYISRSHNQFHIKTINETDDLMPNGDPMVLIDGVPFFNLNSVFAVDPLKIRKLDVVPYTYYWGPSSEEGIYSFTSFKGDLAGADIDPHAVILDYEGLQLQRQFYSPAYDTESAYNSRMPDFRNVLYWAPYITTATAGKNAVSFYTSDQTGRYIGLIQGITPGGAAGSHYFMFNVIK